jgi:hypothetical protein
MSAATTSDFIVISHGSIVILYALTDAALAWADEYLPDDALTWGPNGTVVEPRYVASILEVIASDGLTVGGVT